jgi:hypothetical protein
MASYHTKQDDQFLRRTLDAIYDLDFGSVKHAWNQIPRRTKWLTFASVGVIILVYIALQAASAGIEAYQWSNRTPLQQRLTAPYDLAYKPMPVIDLNAMEVIVPFVDSAALNQARTQALDAARNAAQVSTDTTVESAEVSADTAAQAPVIDEAAIIASVQPEVDQAYFTSIPTLDGYTRYYVYNNVATHPTMGCLIAFDWNAVNACAMTNEPMSVQAADFIDASNQTIRMTVASYETADHAATSMTELFDHSNAVGQIGNYSLVSSEPVSYYYSASQGWWMFTWSKGNYVMSVSGASLAQLEDVIAKLPY